MYPYDRVCPRRCFVYVTVRYLPYIHVCIQAMKFFKDIRKLGVNDTNKSYLDQFRILITEIGVCLTHPYVCMYE